MSTVPFLEYLHEHNETRSLAEQLANVLARRGRTGLIPATLPVPSTRRVAS